MKDILIITNYFPPEIGAASNRIFQLAEGLQQHHFKVTVVAPLPNYPNGKIFESYRGKFKHTSIENNITVHRLWLYASNSKNKLLRLFAMLSYSLSLIWFFLRHNIPKTVIIQSPPLLVAFTSIFFLRSKKRKLILNVSDLWPLAGLELGALKKGLSYHILERIEQFNYKHAHLILGQSQEILHHVISTFPIKETLLYRNFPNFKPPQLIEKQHQTNKIKLVYAGLLGLAQGVYKLCQELDYTNIEFHIYGSGPEQKKIETFISRHNKLDIVYHGEISRQKLHDELITYDIAIIPLLHRIYGSVPSKIFEYARLGLPVVYFGGGEGETIVKENNLGWSAKAGDYNNLNIVISKLNPVEINYDLKKQIQIKALKTFDYNLQLDQLIQTI
ncbi:glycosyltransferase family 4 protein [Aestuariivivens marinum]|uniref:glycosyltransferase family 4 protein n=1 Tax=Aestuariivivens marinum TaxID=2913555 RepID=UPI001F59EDA3|nr:glycosyltransferase family 4 protein [Aestuariivivens marinum]